jgi:transcriptional regulator with XRE-family HTH domain
MQQSGSRGPTGAVTGFVLKLARMSAGLSQEEFAELLGVSLDTVQGWESGRRPLPATRVATLVDVRHILMAANADADLVAALDPAMQADWLIGQTLEPSRRVHPLAAWVTTRRVHDLLVWALVGQRPGWLPQLPANGRRRGPVPDGPELGAAERHEVFARLRALAERADARQESGLQLRRQAAYLAGFDPAPDTSAWLDHLPKPKLVRGAGRWNGSLSAAGRSSLRRAMILGRYAGLSTTTWPTTSALSPPSSPGTRITTRSWEHHSARTRS